MTFLLLAGGRPARADVEVNVTHVGFASLTGLDGGDVIRRGAWVPVTVDVALLNEASFDGSVRLGQFDSDGDKCYDEVDVHLRVETGGTQTVRLYTVANPAYSPKPFSVEVFDEEGGIVQVVSQGALGYAAYPASQPVSLQPDDVLILSLSKGTPGRVQDLVAKESAETSDRPLFVAHAAPSDLPEHAIGLESIDFLVWDDATPDDLSQAQLAAVITWVKHGGTLLIGAARTAGAIRLSEALYSILPVELGELASVEELIATRTKLVGPPINDGDRDRDAPPWEQARFPTAIPIVETTLREGARVVGEPEEAGWNVVTSRTLGRGRVVFVSVRLSDLFSAPCTVGHFFRTAFYLLPADSNTEVSAHSQSLFANVVSAIGFPTTGTTYLFVAGLFSAAYVAIATFGSWGFLRRKGWEKQNWTVFSVVALAASALSVVAVGAVRGFSDRLHQIAVIDLRAGERRAIGTGFFGIKTPIDKELDVWLPPDWVGARQPEASSCFLRPLPVGMDVADTRGFADPEDYQLMPASAVVKEVRFRATLKRFEGQWNGTLNGTVEGKLTARGRDILGSSYVVNNLGVELKNCILLYSLFNADTQSITRDSGTYVYRVGDLSPSAQRVDLVSRWTRVGEAADGGDFVQRVTLREDHGAWIKPFVGILSQLPGAGALGTALTVAQEQTALLLVSTIGEFDFRAHPAMNSGWAMNTWSRDCLRRLDLRHSLVGGRGASDAHGAEPGNAILIGFADDPGPMRLFTRSGARAFAVQEPDAEKSWTMYRVHIPVDRVDSASQEIIRPKGGRVG